ncbi:Nucleoprotein TPR [Lentinula edodes]|uniref:Nucleoprotein TPR n=1 Tax=Lentinula edodes TaxID=5353 RepID=A0A1Q3EJ59_LENED|nr:Nucleoprotein TPR [Lentinula edodes]
MEEDSTLTSQNPQQHLGSSPVPLTSDVDMRNSSVIIRDPASMQHERRPLAHSRTIYMDVDPGPTVTHNLQLQAPSELEQHAHKRSGFDRISELKQELANRDQRLYSSGAEMTIKNHEIANLRAQVSRLESDAQDLQDSLSAQKHQNEGAWASASAKESINQELIKKNSELVNEIQDRDEKLKSLKDSQLAEEKKGSKSTETDCIQRLETECHALNVQIASLQESNRHISQVNKELQASEISTLKADCTSLRRDLAEREQVINNTRVELSQRIDELLTANATLISAKASLLKEIEEMTIKAGEREIDTGEKLKEIEEKERMAMEKLSEIINAFEEDNQQLLHDHELLKEDHEHLQEEVRKLKYQLERTQSEKSETETKLTRALQRLDQLDSEKIMFTQDSEQREHECQAEINGLKTKCSNLVTNIQELELQNATLSREAEEQKRELETEIGGLKAKCSDLDTKIQQSDLEKMTISQKSEQQEQGLQAEVDGLKTKCSDLDTKRLELHAQNATLSQELERSKRELQNETDGFNAKYNTLDGDLKQAVGEKVKLSRDLAQQKRELNDKITGLTTKYSALDQKLQQVQREKATMSREGEQQRQELQDNINGLKTKMQQLATEKQGLAKLSTPVADGNLSDQVAVLQHDNLKKSLEIQRLERELQTSLSNTGHSGQASAGSTPAMPSSRHSVPAPPGPSSTSTRGPPSVSRSTAYPTNGDIIHDIRAVGGLGATLSRAPVSMELSRVRHGYPQWRLPDSMPQNSGNSSKPWNQPKPSPYIKARHKEPRNSYLGDESDELDEEVDENQTNPGAGGSSNRAGPSSRAKGKQKQTSAEARTNAIPPANDLGSDANDEDNSDQEPRQPLDDNDAEPSDVSQVQAQWANGSKRFNGSNSKKYINELARDLLREGFNVRNLWAIFARDGIKLETLENYIKDPIANGPKLRNTRLDKFAADVKSMKASPWNRALTYKFAEKAKEIVAACGDGRFGSAPIDWNKLFSD